MCILSLNGIIFIYHEYVNEVVKKKKERKKYKKGKKLDYSSEERNLSLDLALGVTLKLLWAVFFNCKMR